MKSFEQWYKEDRGDTSLTTDSPQNIHVNVRDLYRWGKEAYEAGQKSFETESRFFFVRYTYRSPSSMQDIIGNHAFEFDGAFNWTEAKEAILDRIKALEFRPLSTRLVIDHIIEIQERDYRSFVEQMRSAKVSSDTET